MSIFNFRDRYPYFTANDDKWKNSVRHNLSMNPHFRKGNKSKHGAGHLWVLADFEEQDKSEGLQLKAGVSTSGRAISSTSCLPRTVL